MGDTLEALAAADLDVLSKIEKNHHPVSAAATDEDPHASNSNTTASSNNATDVGGARTPDLRRSPAPSSSSPYHQLEELLEAIRGCTACVEFLPKPPKPVIQVDLASRNARIAILSQAPGAVAHGSGLPFDDASGERLRAWLGVSRQTFYDPALFVIIPMGFCFPGKSSSGDLPPRAECAKLWHDSLLHSLPNVQLKLLIGQYSQKHYLGSKCKKNLTDTVRAYNEYLPEYFPIVHPSPRNVHWEQKNPWFAAEVIPHLQSLVYSIL
ncbi:uracil-DNA glycosylase family protein [Pelomyxa schiedti]|nr:uracil-DNA glycosylase family protein [Pelomyxa schiedti]